MKSAAIIQARMSSSRLPGKVLMPIGDRPMLQLIFERLRLSKCLSDVIVATSLDVADDAIEELCSSHGIGVARGSRTDVLARFMDALELTKATAIVRVTADCPLIDYRLIDMALNIFSFESLDYLSMGSDSGYPRGINAEVIARSALEISAKEAIEPYEREHVTPFIYTRPQRFSLKVLVSPESLMRADYRVTVDEQLDIDMIRLLVSGIGIDPLDISLADVVKFLDMNPEIARMNIDVYQRHFSEANG
ncbi:MAG: spore coat protein [Betaproteobacteria bacterium]|nr:spore coat protein [Betaproteobacteria bacterium]